MAPLAEYPGKPAKGETNGYDKLEEYDDVVQQNIQAAYDLAGQKVDSTEATLKFGQLEEALELRATSEALALQKADLQNEIGEKADRTEVQTAINAANDATFEANRRVLTEDRAGLNAVGWAEAVYIPKGGTAPAGLDPYVLVIEDA